MTTMLYRPASEPNEAVWGLNVEHRVFEDAEVEAALKDGWFKHPNDIDAAPDPEPPKRRGRPPKEA